MTKKELAGLVPFAIVTKLILIFLYLVQVVSLHTDYVLYVSEINLLRLHSLV